MSHIVFNVVTGISHYLTRKYKGHVTATYNIHPFRESFYGEQSNSLKIVIVYPDVCLSFFSCDFL